MLRAEHARTSRFESEREIRETRDSRLDWTTLMTGGLLLPPALTLCPAAALAAELRTLPTDGGVVPPPSSILPFSWLN